MEQPFTVKIESLRVGGKIDRIDVYKESINFVNKICFGYTNAFN